MCGLSCDKSIKSNENKWQLVQWLVATKNQTNCYNVYVHSGNDIKNARIKFAPILEGT
jgi:hypothetical protein